MVFLVLLGCGLYCLDVKVLVPCPYGQLLLSDEEEVPLPLEDVSPPPLLSVPPPPQATSDNTIALASNAVIIFFFI